MFREEQLKGKCISTVPLAAPPNYYTINSPVVYPVDYRDGPLRRPFVPDDRQIHRTHHHC